MPDIEKINIILNNISNNWNESTDELIHKADISAKMSAAHKGKVFSDEHRAKIAVARKGKTISDELKAKLIAANKRKKGRTHSKETKAKMSAFHKGKVFSDEHRANLKIAQKLNGIARIGVPISPETIAKRVATRKANAELKKQKELLGRQ